MERVGRRADPDRRGRDRGADRVLHRVRRCCAMPCRIGSAVAASLVTVVDNDGASRADRVPPVVDDASQHRRRAWWQPPGLGAVLAAFGKGRCRRCASGGVQSGVDVDDAVGQDPGHMQGDRCGRQHGKHRVPGDRPRAEVEWVRQRDRGRPPLHDPWQFAWVEAEGFTSGATVTIQLQSSSLEVIRLQTARADRKGRVRQLVRIPAASAGEADVVVIGPAGKRRSRAHAARQGGPSPPHTTESWSRSCAAATATD